MTDPRQFWISHAVWPAAVFVAAFTAIAVFDVDRRLAHAWFYDAARHQWLGAGAGAWWARDLLHTHGRWLIRIAFLAASVVWIAGFRSKKYRRPAAYAVLAIVMSTTLVGGLKAVTNVDCPWNLQGFGGDRPYIPILASRPAALLRAKCFPGAHSSSGFALMFGYFLFRGSSPRRARLALAGGAGVGLLFAFGQEARGAHFISHDLASAFIVWITLVWLSRAMLAQQERRDEHWPGVS